MPMFPKNPQRLTPYANFRFKVKWDNTYVAGVMTVSGLTRSTQVIQHREGADPSPIHLAPGQTSYGPSRWDAASATTSRSSNGPTRCSTGEFRSASGEDTSLTDFRKDIIIEVYNEAGMKVIAYNLYRCWVSEFQGMSDLDGLGNALILESITLQNEGWERDDTIVDVAEPTFVLPANNPLQ